GRDSRTRAPLRRRYHVRLGRASSWPHRRRLRACPEAPEGNRLQAMGVLPAEAAGRRSVVTGFAQQDPLYPIPDVQKKAGPAESGGPNRVYKKGVLLIIIAPLYDRRVTGALQLCNN